METGDASFLTQKVALFKFTSNDECHLRNFRLSTNGSCLKWSSLLKRSRDSRVRLCEVDHIDWGESSEAYKRSAKKPLPLCAISIVQKDGTSLDLVAKDEKQARSFVSALQAATNAAYLHCSEKSSFEFNTTLASDTESRMTQNGSPGSRDSPNKSRDLSRPSNGYLGGNPIRSNGNASPLEKFIRRNRAKKIQQWYLRCKANEHEKRGRARGGEEERPLVDVLSEALAGEIMDVRNLEENLRVMEEALVASELHRREIAEQLATLDAVSTKFSSISKIIDSLQVKVEQAEQKESLLRTAHDRIAKKAGEVWSAVSGKGERLITYSTFSLALESKVSEIAEMTRKLPRGARMRIFDFCVAVFVFSIIGWICVRLYPVVSTAHEHKFGLPQATERLQVAVGSVAELDMGVLRSEASQIGRAMSDWVSQAVSVLDRWWLGRVELFGFYRDRAWLWMEGQIEALSRSGLGDWDSWMKFLRVLAVG